MKRSILAAVLVGAAATSSLAAQVPEPPMGRERGAIANPAEFLLSQTGELGLTDAQVTRLAAIARRSAERRRALRTQIDSMRPQRAFGGQRPDSATRERMRQRFEQMRPNIDRLRDQARADRRDAIAVLTPDQQALAWERIARTGQMRRNAFGGGRGFGPGRGGFRGGPIGPGRRSRPPGFGQDRMGPPDDANREQPRPGQRRRPDDR